MTGDKLIFGKDTEKEADRQRWIFLLLFWTHLYLQCPIQCPLPGVNAHLTSVTTGLTPFEALRSHLRTMSWRFHQDRCTCDKQSGGTPVLLVFTLWKPPDTRLGQKDLKQVRLFQILDPLWFSVLWTLCCPIKLTVFHESTPHLPQKLKPVSSSPLFVPSKPPLPVWVIFDGPEYTVAEVSNT